VNISTLSNIAVQMRRSFPSFGGVMLWDESQAYANNRFDLAIKNALVAAGGTGFIYPACSASAYSTTATYLEGSQVSYQGYIWQAKWWTQAVPTSANPNSDWSAISACGGANVPPASSTTTTTTTTTSVSTSKTGTSTSSSPSSSPTGGVCSGVAAWVSTAVYVGGQQAVYNNALWTAQWWTEGDIPGGAAGVWIDNGSC